MIRPISFEAGHFYRRLNVNNFCEMNQICTGNKTVPSS